MEKEELLFEKRLSELSDTAFQKNIVTFTDFMTLHELNIFHTAKLKGAFGQTQTSGGYDAAERQMVAFLPDALYYEWDYPFRIIRIAPVHRKFADVLTHRDYLGAILNLGIDRGKIGDILIMEDAAYVFCHETMSLFLQDELVKVKHTNVTLSEIPMQDFQYQPRYEEVTGTVASVRLDSMLSLAFRISRSRLVELIRSGRVFVNGRLIMSSSHEPKPGDCISARGLGKFRFHDTGSMSKKGRTYITLHKYI